MRLISYAASMDMVIGSTLFPYINIYKDLVIHQMGARQIKLTMY
jgi:hypothetical protein